MKNIRSFTIILILLSSVFTGCVKEPESAQVSTPAPTPVLTTVPAITVTAAPAETQATLAPTPSPSPERIRRIYKSFVDQDYGFKRVVESNYTPFVYENLTLNIHPGDTVIWINDADPDERLTIISEQDLWDNTSAILRWNRKEYSYTFTQPGTYSVYIKEYRRVQHQSIVVSP